MSEPEDTLAFSLDGRPATAAKGELIIAAAERAGTFIPRFCYHPRMRPVGMCRMCLVEVSGPRGATLQPACFVEVQPDMEVTTDSDKVKKAQDGVLEFLLINHPLDCPVCDKGGECPLQDQTLAYGPGESRFVEEKRHFEKPIALSELVLLDRERCIQCSRCTRFADEVAGEAQIDFQGRGEMLEVNTFFERPFSSYFSGNTVQICPVGALTATPYRFTARPWDLDQVETTCTTCAFGCRAAVQSSANRVTRLLGLDSDPVNQSWLCDKGRFAYESTNAPERIAEPFVRKDGELVAVSWHEALAAAAAGLRGATPTGATGSSDAGAGVGVIGGARLTNEGAYAWARLAKGVLGTDSVDAQLGDGLPAEMVLGLPAATIDETVNAGTVVLLTGDVREELPVLFLRLRGAALSGGTSIVELSPRSTSLTPYAAASLRYVPGQSTGLVRSLFDGSEAEDQSLAEARRLVAADDVVVVAGRPSLAEDGA
ncbi:MAG: 2Fe-2S iron-sulfur cluster-binding protein, partial [Acidimicrobiales bacterium]